MRVIMSPRSAPRNSNKASSFVFINTTLNFSRCTLAASSLSSVERAQSRRCFADANCLFFVASFYRKWTPVACSASWMVKSTHLTRGRERPERPCIQSLEGQLRRTGGPRFRRLSQNGVRHTSALGFAQCFFIRCSNRNNLRIVVLRKRNPSIGRSLPQSCNMQILVGSHKSSSE